MAAGNLKFVSKFNNDSSTAFSVEELIDNYFFGISMCTTQGVKIKESTLLQKIKSAQTMIENYLQIKLKKQLIRENPDFIRGDWGSWGFLKCQYPVREVTKMEGFINTTKQIEYPSQWTSWNKPSEESAYTRNIHLVPSGSDVPLTNSIVYSGVTPHLGFFGVDSIPNYWTVEYCTGFEKIPADIMDVIGKTAAMQIFAILGDILLGAGIASQSLSFDGLSQSINTTQSAENSAFSARVKQYQAEIKNDLPRLKDHYKGITFIAL